TPSTRAGRSWWTPADGWSVSSAGWPRAACRPRPALRSSSSSPGAAGLPGAGAVRTEAAPRAARAERAQATGDPPAAPAPAGSEPAVEGAGDGYLRAQRDAPVGGQAVLEGVMMRGVRHWAVAVRKLAAEQEQVREQDGSGADAVGEIEVRTFPLRSALSRHRLLRLPIVRGVVAL